MSPTDPIREARSAEGKYTARLRVSTRDAALHRLCRISRGSRNGESYRVLEVREPTPQNVARVRELLQESRTQWRHAGGAVFVADL